MSATGQDDDGHASDPTGDELTGMALHAGAGDVRDLTVRDAHTRRVVEKLDDAAQTRSEDDHHAWPLEAVRGEPGADHLARLTDATIKLRAEDPVDE
jgi:hypothetical protein